MTTTADPRARQAALFPRRDAQPSNAALGRLVSLRELGRALARRRRIWIGLAVVGLLIGAAAPVLILSKSYSATSTLILQHNPQDNPTLDMANDAALLDTLAVARQAVADLHLSLPAQDLLNDYSGDVVSDQILQVTVNAPTAASAVTWANAIDTAFLTVRSKLFESETAATNSSLGRQLSGLDGQVRLLSTEISASRASGRKSTASGTSVASLVSDRSLDETEIAQLQQTISSNNLTTSSIVAASKVLVGATADKSRLHRKIAIDGASGLVAGLAVGCGIVIAGALFSEGVRERDDFARVFEAPVELSVPRVRESPFVALRQLQVLIMRRCLRRPSGAVRSIARHLKGALAGDPAVRRLAVVTVDSEAPATLAVAQLAWLLCAEGSDVDIVDLSGYRALSDLAGLRSAGVASLDLGRLLVPDAAGAESGDLDGSGVARVVRPDEEELMFETFGGAPFARRDGAAGGADVEIVLATLDPAIGAGPVSRYASEAIVIVTAGRSKLTRLTSVAEMLRHAAVAVRSVVVVGSRRDDDESLGYFRQEEVAVLLPSTPGMGDVQADVGLR